ncbi:SDR family NAD(P)-dependent oxidoreductase [Flagellimonas pacifica]|uniref:NAD(P)-dependent dehydrogenase, short-chain alcohol dehydrogenase family n=1 Tax=Flagellimonas pacifica TaxID=1247520 RepID=A0A285N165_9FLAO|nr:SDR family oxidoreductase [Allomuricauda parva]SNZ01746.1 NAD(P)-dependent dehydrogenase, short-chain alcohol dehydrogenase family [Allomuricauda parva]
MNISFKNKTIIVTGGTSGIGKVSAMQFLESGGQVIVLGRTQSKIKQELKTFSPRLSFYKCDISRHEEIKNVFKLIKAKHSVIDVLVNNAGIQTYGNVVDTNEALWDRTMDTNLKSIYLCTKHTIPLMENSVHPVIINVGSAQGFVSQKNVAAYATSKEALHGLTRSIAINFAPKIRCLAICPGAVYTPMLEEDLKGFDDKESIIEETKNIHLLQRIAAPEEVANFITFFASEKASFATGHAYRVDGGIGLKIQGT